MRYCSMCGAQIPEGGRFCGNCGAPAAQAPAPPAPPPQPGGYQAPVVTAKTLTIARKSQFICAGTGYKVLVDGVDLGNIGVGKSINTRVFTETVRVEIQCTTILMKGIRLWMLLRVTGIPRVDFELQYGGAISATVSGAEILDQGH